jgi:aminomethyltransferase
MSDQDEPLRTALYERHVVAGARMCIDGGWLMPQSYGDPEAEYRQVRSRAGVFDVSHLGRIRIRGDGALDLLDRLCTADVARQEDDTARRSLLLTERGAVLDDVLVVRLEDSWLITCSPHRRQRVLEHLQAHAESLGAKVDDRTSKTSMLAVVGGEAPAILDVFLPEPVSGLARGSARAGAMFFARYVALRAGPTRLWSMEVVLPNMMTRAAWDFITGKAGSNVIRPAGQAVREVLRIEAGLPRAGREIADDADPINAGLEAVVDFERDFLGAEAARAARQRGAGTRRVGLVLDACAAGGSGEPSLDWSELAGAPVRAAGGDGIGRVTSAALSPALGAPIAMALVRTDAAEAGADVLVDAAGRSHGARLVALPFAPP